MSGQETHHKQDGRYSDILHIWKALEAGRFLIIIREVLLIAGFRRISLGTWQDEVPDI